MPKPARAAAQPGAKAGNKAGPAAPDYQECTHHLVPSASLPACVKPALSAASSPRSWKCAVCKDTEDLWLCVGCGSIGCGHEVEGHARQHAQSCDSSEPSTKRSRSKTAPAAAAASSKRGHKDEDAALASLHSVAVSLSETKAFCYDCDDWVILPEEEEGSLTSVSTGTAASGAARAAKSDSGRKAAGGGSAAVNSSSALRPILAVLAKKLSSSSPLAASASTRAPATARKATRPASAASGGAASSGADVTIVIGEDEGDVEEDKKATAKQRKAGAALVPGWVGMTNLGKFFGCQLQRSAFTDNST